MTQDEAASFTLRSLKCSLLSAAAQLRLPEDSRRLQGHYRLSFALLYSRDDTIEALWVQSELASAIRRGWRPPRPMARGGQHPTVEPVFQVPQESPPGELELPSLPPSLARFLYHREVDNLLSAALNTDEEALAVEPPWTLRKPNPKNCQTRTHIHQSPCIAPWLRLSQSTRSAFGLCPGDLCMPC